MQLLISLGSASGYLAVLVLALYINAPEVRKLYSQPQVIWLACPVLLYWISRVWVLAHRGLIHDDPIVFAIEDRISRYVGLLFALIFAIAI